MENNYNNGKVYKIESLIGDKIYVGSTTEIDLKQRLKQHKYGHTQWEKGASNKVMSYDMIDEYGFKNLFITLLETVNCETNDELTTREAYYIKSLVCVNKYIPKRTDREYYLANKIRMNADNMRRYVQNKEHILAKHAEVYICECGAHPTHGHRSRHIKSKKHQKYINNFQEENTI